MAAKKTLPQVPARIEPSLLASVNKLRKAKGQTWNGFIRELLLREIERCKK